ncbi:hypothetical protein DE146DRAFT_204013 [Phaeosphaeria sp. MPI-PUGE-AT-0046c]|nr:hypothetical protein DE146DRAFT_204013 [Phaeosphaeria sp. MPI-PUGE-AT-0046c]
MAASQQSPRDSEENDITTFQSTQSVMVAAHQNVRGPDLLEEKVSPAARTSCAIDELQTVFRTILISRQKKDPGSGYTNDTAETASIPHWTGFFDLFAFPRELRDEIYYYYLYRPNGLLYRRNPPRTFPFEDNPEEVASLFLTSRQIYDEAFRVFCRHNLVEFNFRTIVRRPPTRDKTLAAIVRFFPERPARHLQHLGVSSERYVYDTYRRAGDPYDTAPTDAFAQMLRDACAFKDMFPKMRDFTVSFCKYSEFFGHSKHFEIEGRDEEEKITNCEHLMNNWLGADTVLPPRWFKFRFDKDWESKSLRTQEDIWNKAYARLANDRPNWLQPVK